MYIHFVFDTLQRNKTDNVHMKVTLSCFRETVVDVENLEVVHTLSVCL